MYKKEDLYYRVLIKILFKNYIMRLENIEFYYKRISYTFLQNGM